MATPKKRIQTFSEFYQSYQQEHRRRDTRILHFIVQAKLLPVAVVCGYGFAWVGHFFCEKNRPATFQYPVWSLLSDFRMYINMITGREGWGVV